MAEPDVTPKLPPTTTGDTAGYAPISWSAVAAMAVAGLFVVATLGLGYLAFSKQNSLIEPRLLILPVLAVILAFVARRQILTSEGTRTGIRYANLGWYVAVIGGLSYASYLLAIEFAVRNDADREFLAFANNLKALNPDDPRDPGFYAAMYQIVPVGVRGSLGGPKDAAGMDAGFKDLVIAFLSTDLVRVCSRNPGAVEFRPTGLIDWEQKPREINCTIKALMTTPEGEYDLVVPMNARIEDNRQRKWSIVPSKEGYVKGRRLTPYGWNVEYLEQSARQFTAEMMFMLSRPGMANLAFLAYVHPEWDVARANRVTDAMNRSMEGRAGVAGVLGLFPAAPPQATEFFGDKLFGKPDGKPLTESELNVFRAAWVSPQRFVPSGTVLKSNVDTGTLIALRGDAVRATQPAELVLNMEAQPSPAARVRFMLRLSPEVDASLVARLNGLREEAKTAAKSELPPTELMESPPIIPWRVARIVSDLKAVPVSRDPAERGGGPGGGMGMGGPQ